MNTVKIIEVKYTKIGFNQKIMKQKDINKR